MNTLKFRWTLCLLFVFGMLIAQDIEQLKSSDPILVNGGFSIGSQFYESTGFDPRANPFMWNASGRMEFVFFDELRMPFSFTIGRHGSNIRYPVFNQIGVSPKYKWLTLHAGHRNMMFSRYTLNNHTFLGGGLELNPGKLRIAAMYGRLQRGIREFQDEVDLFFDQAVYDRMGYTLKVGLGSEKSHFDIIYFQAEDKALSSTVVVADSLLPTRANNTVIGFNWKQQLGKSVKIYAEAAVSAFNRNSLSDTIDFGDERANQIVSKFFTPTYSTEAGFAGRAGLNINKRSFSTGFDYERIDPGFETMGAYFFGSDWENYTANLGFGLFKSKMRFNSSFGLQRNNLYELRAETSNRRIGSGNISVQPNAKWGMDLNYSNYNQDHRPSSLVVLNDTLRISSTTHNYGAVLRRTFSKNGHYSSLMLNTNYQETDNQNPLSPAYQNVSAFFASLAFNHQFSNKSSQLQLSLNTNWIEVGDILNQGMGFTLGGRQQLGDKKWNLSLSNTYLINQVSGQKDGFTNSARFSSRWMINKRNAVQLSLFWLRRASSSSADFAEYRGQLSYNHTLPTLRKKNKSNSKSTVQN